MTKYLILALSACIHLLSHAQESSFYAHRLTWDTSDPGNRKHFPVYILDGRSLGLSPAAFSILEELPIYAGMKMRIDFPESLFLSKQPPPYYISSFFPKWVSKGVQIDYYMSGKLLDVHTLTWTDFMENGEYKRDQNSAKWILDGKVCGRGEEAAKKLRELQLNSESVLQVVSPPGWAPQRLLPISAPWEFIGKQYGKMHVYRFIPMTQ